MTIDQHIAQLDTLLNDDRIERAALLTTHVEVTDRIFEKGKNAQGSNIGTYSPGYVKQRQKKGWGASTKVILQYERQLVNDFSLVRVKGGFGSGVKNNKNGEKIAKMEAKYGKIFSLTNQEEANLNKNVNAAVRKYLR